MHAILGVLCQLLNLFSIFIFIIFIAGAKICNNQTLLTHLSFPFQP